MFKRLMLLNYFFCFIVRVSSDSSSEKSRATILRNPESLPMGKKSINAILNALNSLGDPFLSSPKSKEEADNEWLTTEAIKRKGFPVESYELVTDDGYILEIQRIPSANSSHSPVLLQHGYAYFSLSWAQFPVNQSLLYLLSNAGYDCWLGNVRGSPYGVKHKSLDPSSREFWDFGLDEMAMHDLPAIIDLVLNVTHRQQLYYVGYSMGTTLGFMLLSSKLEYNDKIKLFVGEAPVAYVHHVLSWRSPKQRSVDAGFIDALFKLTKNAYLFIPAYCLAHRELCLLIEGWVFGDNPDDISPVEKFQSFLYSLILSLGTRTFLHYIQIFMAKTFQKYDFGALKNFFIYGQLTPLQYNLELITTPSVFYVGLNDQYSNIEDAKLLEEHLPNHIQTYIIEDVKWDHFEFFSSTSIYAEKLLNKHIFQFFNFFDNIIL